MMSYTFPKVPPPPSYFTREEVEAYNEIMFLFSVNYQKIPTIKKVNAINENGFEGYAFSFPIGFFANFKNKEYLFLPLSEEIMYSSEFMYFLTSLRNRGWEISKKVIIQKQPESIKNNCYIASAIYSPQSFEVMTLKKWRDEVLENYFITRILVSIYYKISPALIKYLDNSIYLKKVIKLIINIIIKKIK